MRPDCLALARSLGQRPADSKLSIITHLSMVRQVWICGCHTETACFLIPCSWVVKHRMKANHHLKNFVGFVAFFSYGLSSSLEQRHRTSPASSSAHKTCSSSKKWSCHPDVLMLLLRPLIDSAALISSCKAFQSLGTLTGKCSGTSCLKPKSSLHQNAGIRCLLILHVCIFTTTFHSFEATVG